MVAISDAALGKLGDAELTALIHRLTDELSRRGTAESFGEMLKVVAYVGERVGDAARRVAATNSWSQVAQVSGTSKQAAWERWRG